jgi:hypothetical protein
MSTEIEIASDSESDISSQSSDKFKKWDHFSKCESGKREKLICKYCKNEFSFKTSSSALKKHYNLKHKSASVLNLKITDLFTKSEKPLKIDSEAQLVNFIIAGQHAFSIVEEPHFKLLINSLNPNFNIPSRFSIKRKIMEKFEIYDLKVKNCFENTKSKVSLTTDLWTSSKERPYIAITAHFVDQNYEQKCLLIDFSNIQYPHTGLQIKNSLEGALNRYGIFDKLTSVTADNAPNNGIALDLLESSKADHFPNFYDTFHIRCFAHVINLVVQNGILELKSELEGIRTFLKFLKTSPKQLQLLQTAAKTLSVNFISLKRDINIRWNSTFDITRILSMKDVLIYASVREESFAKYKFSDNIWQKLEQILNFLKEFKEATDLISGKTYASICTVIPIFDLLMSHIEKHLDSDLENVKRCAERMQSKLLEYKDKLINDISIFAVILDPRLKHNYFEDYEKNYYNMVKDKFIKKFNDNYNGNGNIRENVSESEVSKSLHSRIFKKSKKEVDVNEVNRYFEYPIANQEEDPIKWWFKFKDDFPNLSKFAFDILSIPASSVPCEQVFSKSGDLIKRKRFSLSDSTIQYCMCLNSWFNYFDV